MKPDFSNWRVILFFVLILIGISLFAGISVWWEETTAKSERHDLTYTIELSVNTTIENVTLLLPVPELDGTPVLAEALVNGTGYGVPEDWVLSIVMVEGRPMLSIHAARIVPTYHGYPIPVEIGMTPDQTPLPPATAYSPETPVLTPIWCTVMEPVTQAIDTANPLGHEPVFFPGGEFIPVNGTPSPYQGTAFHHTVPVFIQYSSDHPATVSLQARIEGINEIWRGGWVYNQYSDSVSVSLGNGTKGWVDGEGTLVTGVGVYY
jgi:hypothetical protein